MSKETKAAPAPKKRKWPDERCNSWRFPDEQWCHIDRRRKVDRLADIDYLAHVVAEAEQKEPDEWQELEAIVAGFRNGPPQSDEELDKAVLRSKSRELGIVTDILDKHPLAYGRGDNAGRWYLQTILGQRVRLPHRQVFEIVVDTILDDGRVASPENILTIMSLLKEAA